MFAKAAMKYITEGGLSLVPINTKTKRPNARLLPQAKNELGQPLFLRLTDGKVAGVTTENTGLPKGTWEPYQHAPATIDEVKWWLACGCKSVAVIGGVVSGGVEIIDFDVPGYYEQWEVLTDNCTPLPVQRTGGGGMQVAFRSDAPEHNLKLAWHPDPEAHGGRKVAIETRGEAGYALLPPSLHPSGKFYELLKGRFSNIPKIGLDERSLLLDTARSLCQAPKTKQEILHPRTEHSSKQYTGESVIDAYNAKYGIEETLRRYGYTEAHSGRYSRPGKADSAGVSIISGENKSYHHSSNDPLDSDSHGLTQPRSPFDLFLMFDHQGDYRSAVKAAAVELGMVRLRVETVVENTVEVQTMHARVTGEGTLLNTEVLGNTPFVTICDSVSECAVLNEYGFPAVILSGVWHDEWNSLFQRISMITVSPGRVLPGLRRARPLVFPTGIGSFKQLFEEYPSPIIWCIKHLCGV